MSSKFIAVVFVFLSVTQSWGQEIDQPIERVFSVEGYDSNDVVQVMVQGTFKNPCVKLGTMSSIVDVDSRIIELHITSFEPDSTESKPCRLGHVSVPFNSLIYLGQLR